MRTLALTLLVAGLVLAVAPAFAQGTACKTSFDLVGRDAPDTNWYLNDTGAKNPTLTACPGQQITITISQKGATPHNVRVDAAGTPAEPSDLTGEDEPVEYTFTAPASGSANYICELHKPGMAGKINFAQTASATTTPPADEKKSPGLELVGVAVALVGAALLVARRRA